MQANNNGFHLLYCVLLSVFFLSLVWFRLHCMSVYIFLVVYIPSPQHNTTQQSRAEQSTPLFLHLSFASHFFFSVKHTNTHARTHVCMWIWHKIFAEHITKTETDTKDMIEYCCQKETRKQTDACHINFTEQSHNMDYFSMVTILERQRTNKSILSFLSA